jgi:serine/threonine protein kinase
MPGKNRSLSFAADEELVKLQECMHSGADTPVTQASKTMSKCDMNDPLSSPGGDTADLSWDLPPGGVAAGKEGWTRAELGPDYTHNQTLGRGSYGEVAKAIHNPTRDTVAIKRVFSIFNDPRDARCILRELRILRLV